MADPEVRISSNAADESGDVEMQGGDGSADVVEVGETGAADAPGEEMPAEDPMAAIEVEKPAARLTFAEWVVSPVPPSQWQLNLPAI